MSARLQSLSLTHSLSDDCYVKRKEIPRDTPTRRARMGHNGARTPVVKDTSIACQ